MRAVNPQLVTEDVYARWLALSVQEAESREGQSFHCRTPDCIGWCVYEDDVNTFECPVCGVANCLTCKAQHVGETCRQYQEGLQTKAAVDVAARRTQKKIKVLQ
jgi:RanBP-type and C3HC4-type zinc finger-containing protein 1